MRPETRPQTGDQGEARHSIMMNKLIQTSLLAVALLTLTACGGGGGDDSSSSNSSDVALFTVPSESGGYDLVVDIAGEELVISKDLLPPGLINDDGSINEQNIPNFQDLDEDELNDFLEEVDGDVDVTIDPDNQVVSIEKIGDPQDTNPVLIDPKNIGANPEPVSSTLGFIALTATALAATRRRRNH